MKEIIQLKTSEIKDLKIKFHKEQNNVCPILNKEVPIDKMVLDHLHKLNSEEAGKDGKGCCRGALEFRANAWEGKIVNAFKRLGLNKDLDLVEGLRRLADYLENNRLNDDVLYIHPSEKEPEKIVSKKNYNKLKKLYINSKRKAKFPEYPASKKLTIKLKELFEEYQINPYN